VNANLTTIHNEVISLGDNDAIATSGWSEQSGALRKLTDVGQPVGSFYGYIVEGIFQSYDEIKGAALPPGLSPFDEAGNLLPEDERQGKVAPGDIRYLDFNGEDENGELTGTPDGIINESDRDFLGSPIPDMVYGFNFSAAYKGFDLFMLFQGVKGSSIFSETKFYLQAYHRAYNQGVAVLDRWTESNTGGTVPRAIPSANTANNRVSDRWVEDGSYLRLKNFQIGYTLPNSVQERLKLSNARIYFSGQNLLTFTDYLGYDPEVGSNGIDDVVYPQPRTLLLGLQIGF